MKIGTYNIRKFSLSDFGFKFWFKRKRGVANIIEYYSLDVMAIQEMGNKIQKASLLSMLKGYSYIGKETGFIYKNKFEPLFDGSFFVSPTPEKESIGWDAQVQTKCVWACFYDYEKSKIFYIFNVHLSPDGTTNKVEGIKVIEKKIKEITEENKNAPIFLLGDFNMTEGWPEDAYAQIKKYGYSDANKNSEIKIGKATGTLNFFLDKVPTKENRIDFIFTKNVKMEVCDTSGYKYKKHFPSDHLPIILKCELK